MRKLLIFQYLVGAMDGATGVLLVLAPAATLHLMGVGEMPGTPVMMSWVGVFVLAVGASYFLVWRIPRSEAEWGGWRMQWKVTGMVRLAVGVFVAAQLAAGGLEMAWVSVAVTDLVVAGVQFAGLGRGWLKGEGDAR